MPERRIKLGRITRERDVINSRLKERREFATEIKRVGEPKIPTVVKEDDIGRFRAPDARRAATADIDMIHAFEKHGLAAPTFLEAGPRALLYHDPSNVRAAIVTAGGLAPGIHCVINSIVKRHFQTYKLGRDGRVFGVYRSFEGLCNFGDNHVELTPPKTEEWLDQGGSKLGIIRYYPEGMSLPEVVATITDNLKLNNIDILYVIGGDGSLEVAHDIATANPKRSIVGIPKTMDNDILWVWHSFGFDTAVERAAVVINTLRTDAEATRRVCLVELFGAESGFVAANATVASGHVKAVLIPEVFDLLDTQQAEDHLVAMAAHIRDRSARNDPANPHGVVVIAEGVGSILEHNGSSIGGEPVTKDTFATQFSKLITDLGDLGKFVDNHNRRVGTFVNQPKHFIRAVPANAHDEIYCESLGALAVDNAMSGYTDFMISQWLSEYVLVPLSLVRGAQKGIAVNGLFWKQVVACTGQPLSPVELSSFWRGKEDVGE